jgi:hypothetical protein
MRFVKRVYVAGVGYTCYLTKSPIASPKANSHSEEGLSATEEKTAKKTQSPLSQPLVKPLVNRGVGDLSKTKIGKTSKIVNTPSGAVQPSTGSEIYLDHIRGSTKSLSDNSFKENKYTLNLKIGFSDLKFIDLTPYLTENIEILVVGKEIITTPGYQELATEIESLVTASEIKSIIIIRGDNKLLVNSLAALIRNLRPYSVYKGIGLRLEGDKLNLKTFVKNKH